MSISKSLKQKIPESYKPFLRILLKYLRLLKRNHIKEFKMKQMQEKLLRENYSSNANNLIIFLTPGYDIVNGGILSISSIYEESIKLKYIHKAEVVMCTTPGNSPLLRYTKFNNQNYIYRFSQVLSYFQNIKNLMIHIPEYCIDHFLINISNKNHLKLNKIEDIHINIMIQNIKLLSPVRYVKELRKFGKITCTTAHEQYSTLEISKKLGIPLHKLSTHTDPEQFNSKEYIAKKNLMIVSPDYYPRKLEFLNLVSKQLPHLKMQIIKNLTYDEYKEVISQAKWAITFGEGLDGYFIGTIFSGGISFAVYNSTFFTKDFQSLRTVYDNYDLLIKNVCLDLKDLDNEIIYNKYQRKQFELCCRYYNYKKYINNLELFYREKYTYK